MAADINDFTTGDLAFLASLVRRYAEQSEGLQYRAEQKAADTAYYERLQARLLAAARAAEE